LPLTIGIDIGTDTRTPVRPEFAWQAG
jgi:hypothetical protein